MTAIQAANDDRVDSSFGTKRWHQIAAAILMLSFFVAFVYMAIWSYYQSREISQEQYISLKYRVMDGGPTMKETFNHASSDNIINIAEYSAIHAAQEEDTRAEMIEQIKVEATQ